MDYFIVFFFLFTNKILNSFYLVHYIQKNFIFAVEIYESTFIQ